MDDKFNTDHDMIVTLVANVEELRKNIIKNHEDLKGEINELKNGFASRLEKVELKADQMILNKLSTSDWVLYRNNEFVPLLDKVEKLERVRAEQKGSWSTLQVVWVIIIGIGSAIFGIGSVILSLYYKK